MIGQTISHYKILEKLGEGGMGVVYKAEDTKLDRLVALKFLPAHLAASEQDKARFIQEAKAASSLNHPNVCTIHDIQEHDGQMFIVMEFVDGQTLRQKLPTITQGKAIDIGIQIAEGLSAAHDKGIVHRDIKPENIMIRKDGIVQIMDFGLAKLRASGSKITRLTKEGSTVGTAGYMSPEQVQGQDADHRSDIFSLGVMLYEMFAGELPFKGVHETALMYEIVNVDAAPISSIKPDIDPELDRIVLECLQKDPDERYNSVKDIAKDLKRFKRESSKTRMSRTFPAMTANRSAAAVPVSAREEQQSSKKVFNLKLYWLLIAFAVGVLVTGLFWRPWQAKESSSLPIMQFTIKLPDSTAIPIGSMGLNISPDGKFMSFLVQSGLDLKVLLRSADRETFEPVIGSQLSTNGLTIYHEFSPDGQWIAFNPGTSIQKSSVFGGASVAVCEVGNEMRGLWWGSDKNIYFGHISSVIYRVSEDGGKQVPVTTLDSASGEISHRFPELLPDGKSILFTIKFNTITSFDEAAIAVFDTKSGVKKILIRGGTYARYVPTGHLVYARGSFIYAVPFDLEKLEVTGSPKQLFKGGWMNPFSGEVSLAFSRDGTLLYIPRGIESYAIGRIKWLDMQGQMTSLVDTTNSYFSSALSPDGEKLALHVQGANDDVWMYHIGRKSLTRLTFGGGNSGYPVWSVDGRYVMYMSERGGVSNIYRTAWDGSGKEERLTTSPGSQFPRSVSPDGKFLSFVQDNDIWILALDSSRKTYPFFTSPATEANPVFSPDGHYIAYETNESGKYEIVIVPFPSRAGKWQVSSGGGSNPIWSPSGNEIYFTQGTTIYSVDIHPGNVFDYSAPKKVLDLPPDGQFLSGISLDGKKFALVTVPTKELSTSEFTLVTNWFQQLRNTFSTK
ncbi:MAG TPA: protein kinase [Bacteroidota bacterium]|nr:protein kinase [Bacteroidota bacterium]